MRRANTGRAALAFALAAVLGQALPGGAAPAVPTTPDTHVRGRLLVKFAAGAARGRAHRAMGARLIRSLTVPGWDLVALPARLNPDRAMRLYRRLPGVAAAEPVLVAGAALEPNDPCFATGCEGADQWNLYAVAAPLAWDRAEQPLPAAQRLSSNPVTVAVIDTQIDFSHPDFRNAGGATTDAADGGQLDWARARSWVPPGRGNGGSAYHGTFVAGILGAAAGNGADIAGLGYGALILPIAVLDGSGTTDAASLAEAVAYAHGQGARVLNLSLGTTGDSQAVHDAIIAATAGGALVVAAAGNNTRDVAFYPGSYPEVLSVSGVDAAGAPSGCSNYNDNVSVAAPASAVLSLAPMPERRRVVACGTSAAAPHVSALAAMLFAQDPSRTAAQVREIIEQTADDDARRPGRDRYLGHGRINADRAMRRGTGPEVSQIAATVPPRGGGTSTITAVARSPLPITGAELYLDRPGRASSRVPLRPGDGAWGGTTEALTGTVEVTSEQTEASHGLYARAFDGAWGGGARGVLPVDRTAPQIMNVRAEPAVRAALKQPVVSFALHDNVSTIFAYTVTIATPDGVPAWDSGRVRATAGPQSVYWRPPASGLPGHYRVTIWAWDQAGNPAFVGTQQLIV